MKLKINVSPGIHCEDVEIIIISNNSVLAEKIKNAVRSEIRRFSKAAGKEISYKIISTQE